MHNPKIGDKVYPVDNSYSQDLSTGEMPTCHDNRSALAGNSKTLAARVTVIFEPFKMKIIDGSGRSALHEFVIVEYNGGRYLVLNVLTDEPYPLEEYFDYSIYNP